MNPDQTKQKSDPDHIARNISYQSRHSEEEAGGNCPEKGSHLNCQQKRQHKISSAHIICYKSKFSLLSFSHHSKQMSSAHLSVYTLRKPIFPTIWTQI